MAFNVSSTRVKWLGASMAARLVIINVVIFLLIRIGDLVCILSGLDSDSWLHLWMIPSSLHELAERPWTLVLYMFSQFDVLHCLFNLLWLYGFSRLFMSFSTPRQLLALYLFSGLAGGIFFLAGMNLLPALAGTSGWLIGSSAAVMGIVMASGIIVPDMPIGLLFLGQIKLKWVAAGALVLFVICGDPANIGGQLAHIGGALMGAWYGVRFRKGRDITRGFNHLIDNLVNIFHVNRLKNKTSRKPKVKPFKHKSNKTGLKNRKSAEHSDSNTFSDNDQAQLDIILDKIKKSGYTALSSDEKRRLFDVSKRIK